jgi:hypothetical protein
VIFFLASSGQSDVYDIVKHDIEDTLRGRNSTILAYGQTGSGKTFTMEGSIRFLAFAVQIDHPNEGQICLGDIKNVDQWGVVPRSIKAIFEIISTSDEEVRFC